MDGAQYFAKLDLKDAYWQTELDEEAKQLSVINTTNGVYTMNRLQMGMKNAASIFQKVIESTLGGIPGVIAYQDDVLMFAATEASLRRWMTATRNKLEECGFSINEQKSATVSESISFLGYELVNAAYNLTQG